MSVIGIAGPPATTLPPEQIARTQKAAQEFEAMALGQMLAPMFKTVEAPKNGFGGGAGEEAWQPMLVTELGKQVARAGGVGLARPVMEQMLRSQEAQIQQARDQAPTPERANPERANPERAIPGRATSGVAAREQTAVEQLLLERPAVQRDAAQPTPRPGA